MSRVCTVCGKSVANTDVDEHLKTNHLGPHYFWFSAQRFRTHEPSMTVCDVKQLVNCSSSYQFFQDRNGGQPGTQDLVYFSDDQSVDLTREPHFSAVPPATMHRGLP